jgi:ribosome maturation factor RimP
MIRASYIETLLAPAIKDSGMFLVNISVQAGNVIRVSVDSGVGVTLDDCIRISRYLEERLDRDSEDFELQVSSPGLTEPFKVKQQYEKNIGREIKVITSENEYKGILKHIGEETIELENTKKIKIEGKKKKEFVTELVTVNFADIKSAKCVIQF